MEEEPKKNLDICGSLSLIDFSFEDDFLLIPTSSDRLRDKQSSGLSENHNGHGCIGGFGAESAQEGDSILNSSKEMEEAPVLEPSEPSRTRRAGKCNLRKSLAWDSAFFTSEGILDPDELEVVSKTFKKSPTHALPDIQEDLRKSTESTCTLGSDASALESLEIELFEDIRASIQKSAYECGNASNVASSSSKTRQGEADIPCTGLSQVEHTSRNRMKPLSKPLSSSKRHGLSKQVLEKNSKEVLVHPRAAVTRSGDQNSSLKPPKILPRVKPPSTAAATKKTLASSECIKIKNNTVKASGSGSNQKCAALSKKPVSGATPIATPSSIPSPESSYSRSSSSAKALPSTPSSQNRSGSTKTLRNRADSRNANPSSTDSIMKTPLRISRNKIESRNSNLSAYLMSTSKFSPSISPASSIDGLSSVSSSSTCTASQMSNSSKASLDISSTSSCGGDFLVRDAPKRPAQRFIGREDSVAGFPSQCVEKASLGAGVLCHPAASNAPRSVQNFRPSGLRMPSPKMGFFDAEKTAVRTSNTGLQFNSGLRSGLLRNASGISNLDGGIKQRPKLQYARPLTQIGSMKFNSQLIGPSNQASVSSMKPASTQQPQQLPNPSRVPSSTPRTKNHPSTVVAVHGSSLRTSGGSNYNTLELQAEAADKEKYGQSSDLNTGEHDDRNAIKMYGATESERQVHLREIEIVSRKENEHCCYVKANHEFDVKSVDDSKLIYNSGEHVQDKKVDFLQGSSEPSSFGNRSVLVELNMELAAKKAVDKTSMFPFLEKGIRVPSPVAHLDPAVELEEVNLTAKSLNEPKEYL